MLFQVSIVTESIYLAKLISLAIFGLNWLDWGTLVKELVMFNDGVQLVLTKEDKRPKGIRIWKATHELLTELASITERSQVRTLHLLISQALTHVKENGTVEYQIEYRPK